MESKIKKEPIPDKAPSSVRAGQGERGTGREQTPRAPKFQGSCKELKGWVFDSTDSQGADKFDMVQDKIARYIMIKITYGTELKSSTNKLQESTITNPSAPG
eukprot:2753829-Ditylum_brightwellii.AAC.1